VAYKRMMYLKENTLVVEDERKIARLLLIEQERKGYQVRIAADGTVGWNAYQQDGIAFNLCREVVAV
jgi:Response regulator containing CheY-like receiver, AAA-type ATPase, and DNA-binding domains